VRLLDAERPHPALQASLHGDIGWGYRLNGHLADADRHYETAMRIYEELGQINTPATASIQNNWALVSSQAGDFKRALEKVDGLIAATERSGPARLPVYVLNNHATMLSSAHEVDGNRMTGEARGPRRRMQAVHRLPGATIFVTRPTLVSPAYRLSSLSMAQ
jgi:hypothetical protein